MNNTSNKNQYVIYPHNGNNPQDKLLPQDKLIYLSIRRYMSAKTMECFPSYSELTRKIGVSSKTIKKSVDNLVREGYLETRKEGRKIIYKFNNRKHFEPFSLEFLDNQDLTFTEKSYIVASQQYMFKNESEGIISYSNRELAKLINMSDTTISRCNRSLEEKGFLKGSSESEKRFQLRELDQLFIWKFQEIDERVDRNSEDIQELKEEIARLRMENEEIKKKVNMANTYIL